MSKTENSSTLKDIRQQQQEHDSWISYVILYCHEKLDSNNWGNLDKVGY